MTFPSNVLEYAFGAELHTAQQTQEAMRNAGFSFGNMLGLDVHGPAQVCVVCSAQDADCLARGVIDALVEQGQGARVRLLCTWSEPLQAAGLQLNCIVKQYCEPLDPVPTVFVVLSGFWREGSAGLTNLFRALSYTTPERVVVAGLAADGQAFDNMLNEVPPSVRDKVEPRFGALYPNMQAQERECLLHAEQSLYASMGFAQPNAANKHIPDLVKERRRLVSAPEHQLLKTHFK